MISRSRVDAQEHTHERQMEEEDQRDKVMAAAIDDLCAQFDPKYPNGEPVTPMTRLAYARLAQVSDALRNDVELPPMLPAPVAAELEPCAGGVVGCVLLHHGPFCVRQSSIRRGVTDATQVQQARVATGWSNERDGTVIVLEDGTYLSRHERDGRVEWVEREPVARTFRAATQAR
jgi:hypothetical protein